ncbi:hypothetical protein [Nocardia sp. CS682]|uniref:hypothetical protein n=1 Tax=Nocardia sp. CS682 TaxID=1047172 RepID=UPI001074C4BC|nr:hypothetical protein [Nocardia sp. CS682]QBS43803.1 hypothetical protein DMB37_30625 [Nocardia sp. CS682]
MAPITIDPNAYYSAAKGLFELTTDLVSAVTETMTPALRDTFGMGGHYPAVVNWNTAYKQHTADLLATITAYAAATQQLGDVLNLAGHNWQTANFNANRDPSKGAAPVKPTVTAAPSFGTNGIPPIPDPGTSGPSEARLTFWPDSAKLLLLSTLTTMAVEIPDGNTETLNRAGSGWRAFAQHPAVAEANTRLNTIAALFDHLQAPDVPEIRDLIGALKTGASAIAAATAGLASATINHHDTLADLRTQIINATSRAFPDLGAKATVRSTGVDVMPQSEASESEVVAAAAVYRDTINTHPLFAFLRKATFEGMDGLGIKARLIEIAGLRDDAIVRLDSYSAEPVKCSLNPNWESELEKIDPDVRPWVGSAVKYGNTAGIDPRLVLAIVYNEGGYRSDSFIEREMSYAYDVFIREGGNLIRPNSLGLTNMKEDTFNELKSKFPAEFSGKNWSDLKEDPDLAIMAATYNLKRIQDQYAGEVPDELKEKYTLDQFLAAGYNAERNIPDYFEAGDLGPVVQGYVRMTNTALDKAQQLLSGMYTCK